METNNSDRTETFVRLLTEHERRLGRYAMTLLPRVADCDEVLQEAKLAMWRSFDRFEIGTDFGAWGRKIIYRQALRLWERSPATRHRWLDEEALEVLVADATTLKPAFDRRGDALGGCVEKLSEADRSIIRLRYQEEMSVEAIADQTDRTVAAIYRKLSRLRKALHDCITLTIRAEATT